MSDPIEGGQPNDAVVTDRSAKIRREIELILTSIDEDRREIERRNVERTEEKRKIMKTKTTRSSLKESRMKDQQMTFDRCPKHQRKIQGLEREIPPNPKQTEVRPGWTN